MGHISNIVAVAEAGGMNKFQYTNGTLDQTPEMGYLQKNKMVANDFKTFLDANVAASNANPGATGARADAVQFLQNARCTNLWDSDPTRAVEGAKSVGPDGRCYSELDDDTLLLNVNSRMMQKEGLSHAQCASFIAIIIVQWADLVICKTRWLSITEQGMKNPVMNFALVFELLLGALLCYVTPIGTALGTRDLRIIHWFTAMPFSIYIFLYDETRKYLMRSTSTAETDPVTGRTLRNPGWLERNTYY